MDDSRPSPPPNSIREGALPNGVRWRLSFSVTAYGVQVRIRSNEGSLIDGILERLPPNSINSAYSDTGPQYDFVVSNDPEGKPQHSLYINQMLHARCALSELLRIFETEVQIHVAEMAPDRVFVHAGVVGWRGSAIVIPGRSYTGKSTLVAELVRAGADYYSDEYAVLDATGQVHPYARPLAIRSTDGASTNRVTIDALGGRLGTKPIPVGTILVTKFVRRCEWKPERLSAGRGMLALFANTVPARRIPDVVLPTLHQIVGTSAIYGGDRGEADQIVKFVMRIAPKN